MNWQRSFELAYSGLIGIEVGFVADLVREVLR
jgi:hypothetical protein